MKRALLCVLATVVVASLGWDAPAASSALVYQVNFNVRLSDAIPAGSVITCRARIAPDLAAGRPGALAPTAGTAASVATVTGSVAHCALEFPVTWAAVDARRAALLSYEVEAETPTARRTVSGPEMELPRPPADGAERLNLSLTL